MAEKGMSVCVTGAGGYVASWLVKLLLSQGYTVHGTVRNPEDDKNAHLRSFENLKLFKAELLDFDSILAAVKGCNGLFHVASPAPSASLPNPEVEIVEPAVKGTLNVLKACSKANVYRVVVVSSCVAVVMNPNWPKGKVLDESCWSDTEYCRRTNNWYYFSKTAAESEARKYAETSGLDLITVCPSLVLGPMLQRTPNSSSLFLLKLLKEGYGVTENHIRAIVDVRDVAEAIKLVYETPQARGRYLCTSHMINTEDLVQTVKEIYPNYDYPKRFKEGKELPQLSSEKLQGLGWKYKPLKVTLVDSVENYKKKGLVN
ncbi:cinnamoyl-CoA reductase 1-like [Salvia divinorum]|uniref:Cinnamoyl-CoA reductase 1-like n=1 Tax=Salvia divinorum TaxID=28513 RepID=A0ABD1G956_SALDI